MVVIDTEELTLLYFKNDAPIAWRATWHIEEIPALTGLKRVYLILPFAGGVSDLALWLVIILNSSAAMMYHLFQVRSHVESVSIVCESWRWASCWHQEFYRGNTGSIATTPTVLHTAAKSVRTTILNIIWMADGHIWFFTWNVVANSSQLGSTLSF